jgi:hypothetical protein
MAPTTRANQIMKQRKRSANRTPMETAEVNVDDIASDIALIQTVTDASSMIAIIEDQVLSTSAITLPASHYQVFEFHLTYTLPKMGHHEEQGILVDVTDNSEGSDFANYITGSVTTGMVHCCGLATPEAFSVPVRDWRMERKKLLGYVQTTEIPRFQNICDSVPVPGENGIARVKGKRMPPLKNTVKKWARLWTLNAISELKYHAVLLEKLE